MARILFVFFVCLLPAVKADCDCARTYGLMCETSCSNGLTPIRHQKCDCCCTCPKLEYEECGGPYFSKGQCNNDSNGKIPKLYCSAWETYTEIDAEALMTNGTDIVGTCLRNVCVKVCSDRTPAKGSVCGTDSIEYKSKCHLKQKNNCYIEDPADKVKVADKSNCPCFGVKCEGIGQQCVNKECVCKGEEHCDKIYEPVCGSNGLLYQSECHANATICKAPPEAKFTTSSRTCEELNRCRNECTGQGQICKIESGRFVGCECQLPDKCQSDGLPEFCATNGFTYTSECEMDAHACAREETVEKEKEGSCSTGPPSSSGLSSPPGHIYE